MGKGKTLHPADAFRKEQKKKEAKRNAKTKATVREVNKLLSNPQKIQDEIDNVQKESDANRLDKGLKDRIKELQMMKSVALKKQMSREALSGGPAHSDSKNADTGGSSITYPPAPPPRRQDESIYFHPQFNPTGAPPPGQPMMYRTHQAAPSSAGPPGSRPVYGQPVIMHPYSAAPRPRGPAPIPNPPRTAPLVGGMNGVPLPPPRPMALPPALMPRGLLAPSPGVYGPATSSQNHHSGIEPPPPPNRRHHVAPRAAVDPLDPSASGYTERFDATPSNRVLQSSAVMRSSVSPAVIAHVPISTVEAQAAETEFDIKVVGPSLPPTAQEMPEVSNEVLMRQRYIMPDEDESGYYGVNNDYEDEAREDIAECAPISAEELMRRRYIMSDEDDNTASVEDQFNGNEDKDVGPQMPPMNFEPISAEELMRRRNLIMKDGNGETAPAGAMLPPPDNAMDGPDLGPQGPEAGTADWSYYPTAEEVYGTAPSSGLTVGAGVSDCPAPRADENGHSNSALQLFSAYGDSDDESVESKDQSPVPELTRLGQNSSSSYSADAHSNSVRGAYETAVLSSHPSQANRTIPDIQKNIYSDKVPVPNVSRALLGPKIVKVDSDLTGFVPAAIRVKRPMKASVGAPTVKKVKVAANCFEEMDHIESSKASWVAPSTKSAVKKSIQSDAATSVDTEYSDFMKEIEALNAM